MERRSAGGTLLVEHFTSRRSACGTFLLEHFTTRRSACGTFCIGGVSDEGQSSM